MRSLASIASAAPVQTRRLGAAACLALAVASFAFDPRGARRRGAECGDPSARASVVGGQAAEPGTFPWMAFIVDFKGNEEAIACSGTVLAPNLVLTAAHCAVDLETGAANEASGYRVVTGNVDWASSERQVSGVSQVDRLPRLQGQQSLPDRLRRRRPARALDADDGAGDPPRDPGAGQARAHRAPAPRSPAGGRPTTARPNRPNG